MEASLFSPFILLHEHQQFQQLLQRVPHPYIQVQEQQMLPVLAHRLTLSFTPIKEILPLVESGRQITQPSTTISELDKPPVAQILGILQHHYTQRQELRHLLVMEIQLLRDCIAHQEMHRPLELLTALPSDFMFLQEADKPTATV
jgi:hypothetical protein